jgi:hypothetical protein
VSLLHPSLPLLVVGFTLAVNIRWIYVRRRSLHISKWIKTIWSNAGYTQRNKEVIYMSRLKVRDITVREYVLLFFFLLIVLILIIVGVSYLTI